ncbi:ras-related protein Rab-22A-like [Acanthaster planci]|uniref:Ras-related protein Rab-22A-like n=1 Tax=Acanthaster planci TaxID=133434 RepID=A0A8B7YI01_ACAPL|nr:ras-related protein Rab-22A-like [Acanthaster planci]XP_022092016.1 ras-related protein Rab-22A-like [Acanthaster planci]XP_022092017.1 ras-related protein Rab-22A-like [Acanthaster planci]
MSASGGGAVKVCLVGNSTVGKSCIAARLVHNHFHEQTKTTIGSAYLHKELNVDGDTVNVNIWDTAGQERFRALAPLYYRDASGIVLVYDITNEKSFQSLRTVWVPALRACTKSDLVLVLVGNKLDLEETGRVIPAEEARGYADFLDAIFLEASAKTGHNVDRIFVELVKKIRTLKKSAAAEDEKPTNVIKLPGGMEASDSVKPGPSPNGSGIAPDGTPGAIQKKKKSNCKCN